MDSKKFSQLLERIGTDHASRRLQLQTTHSAIRSGPTGVHFSFENLDGIGPFLKTFLGITGLWTRAVRNTLSYRIIEQTITLPSLPKPFHGFRILHLSDLHIEGIVDKGQTLRNVIRDLEFDLCVITGDFRLLTYGDYENTLVTLAPLIKEIQCTHGIIGILGNHDFLEMVSGLEDLGIRMLLNESLPIQQGEETIWIVGLDDPHWYEVADLPRALRAVPDDAIRILLVHSPEVIEEAATAGMNVYLCGHSHGGQICLPGGTPIIVNSRCTRKFTSGAWQYNKMQGFTSRGVGTSLLPVRISCRPEVIVHRLVST